MFAENVAAAAAAEKYCCFGQVRDWVIEVTRVPVTLSDLVTYEDDWDADGDSSPELQHGVLHCCAISASGVTHAGPMGHGTGVNCCNVTNIVSDFVSFCWRF